LLINDISYTLYISETRTSKTTNDSELQTAEITFYKVKKDVLSYTKTII